MTLNTIFSVFLGPFAIIVYATRINGAVLGATYPPPLPPPHLVEFTESKGIPSLASSSEKKMLAMP